MPFGVWWEAAALPLTGFIAELTRLTECSGGGGQIESLAELAYLLCGGVRARDETDGIAGNGG